MSEGAGDGSGRATGLAPGALTALLAEVAAAPEKQEAEAAVLPAGTLIGRFEIVRELGRGGFGVVYEARDRDLGRQVALKVVRPGRVAADEGKVTREAEAIARLAHPNLVTLFDVGQSEHGPYLVFELLRGKTLDLRLEEGAMPVQEAVHVAAEVARGLAHAHAEGVVHRDLKPSNVFVTNKGQVKILDFGMAHAFGRRRLSGGTPAYMAPEQWEDEPEDERTDVFALGVMLYRMLTGEYPFPEGKGRWSSEGGKAPRLDVPGAPELGELVERMLDPATKARPRDGAAVLAALAPIEERLRARPADGTPPAHARRRKATLGDLLAELKRRHVFRVMVGYGIFAFAAVQVTEPVMHGAHLPDWVLTAVLALLALGFPVAVVLAWVYDLTSHGVKRTPSSSDPQAAFGGRTRWLPPLAVAATVLLIVAAGALGWLARHRAGRGPAPVPGSRPTVAVADFANETGERELDSLSGLLITALEQSTQVRVLTRSRMFDVLKQLGKEKVERIDETLAREVGRKAGAQALLLATIRKLGDSYVVDMRALDPVRDEYLFTVSDRASGKEAVFDLVDRLGDVSRRRLAAPGTAEATVQRNVASITTGSVAAWDRFFRARQAFDHGGFDEARTELQAALAIDPDFPLAHYQLAVIAAWGSDGEGEKEQRPLFEAAEKRASRLPEKERLILGSVVAYSRGQVTEALRLRDRAAESFPLDKEAVFYAGDGRLHSWQQAEAIPYFVRALQLDPSYALAKGHLLFALSESDVVDQHVEWLRREASEARHFSLLRTLAETFLSGGYDKDAAATFQKATDLDGSGRWPARTYASWMASAGQAAQAEEGTRSEISRLERDPQTKRAAVLGRQGMLGEILVVQGRLGEARAALAGSVAGPEEGALDRALMATLELSDAAIARETDEIVRMGPRASGLRAEDYPTTLVRAATALASSGHVAEAARIAARARSGGTWAAFPPPAQNLLDSVAAWAGGNRQVAAEGLRRASADTTRHVRYLGSVLLGSLALSEGDCTGALAAMERARSVGWSRHGHYPQAFMGPGVLLSLARCYEQTGNSAMARERVDELLQRWERADPGIPILVEAKQLKDNLAVAPAPAAPVSAAGPPSIAVLPFADMSPKHDQEYFADGVAESILNALAHVEGLKVVGRTSSFFFKGKPEDLKAIGNNLGVANVLEGSLRKDGNGVRITAKLIRVADGTQLWSETYDRKLAGIFKVQDEIAAAVTKALQLRLLPTGRSAPRSHAPDAYASFLLGRQLLSRMTYEELPRAIASFEKAVTIEPTFADAWAGLSLALDERSYWQSSLEGILRDKQKALDAANRAVDLAPGEGAGYAARAQLVDIRGWDWRGSLADARRAVELEPNDVQARIILGKLLYASGNREAVQELRRATELDPLSTVAWNQLGFAAGITGDGALRQAAMARAREINPRNDWWTLVGEGSREWAEAVLREPVGPLDGPIHYQRVRALRVLGREAEARTAFHELIACCSYSGAWQVALTYDNAGERDKAFEWLERALVNMDRGIRYVKLAPRFKGDPRTATILKKMNLPVD